MHLELAVVIQFLAADVTGATTGVVGQHQVVDHETTTDASGGRLEKPRR